jgi:hypothetical protein
VKRSQLSCIGVWLGSLGLFLASPAALRGQSFNTVSPGRGSSTTTAYNFSGTGSYFSGGSSIYVPFNGIGGFIPYRPGPGGGLGVPPGMRTAGGQVPTTGMGAMPGSGPVLGRTPGQIAPLAPISQGAVGSRPGGSMGSMGGLIRRSPSAAPMGGMARPPVGSYPFRQPPSLLGPAAATPSMSM